MWTEALLTIVFALAIPSARAADTPLDRWAKHFEGAIPAVLEKSSLLGLIAIDPACAPQARALWDTVDRYGAAAYRSNAKLADDLFATITQELKDGGDCEDDLLKTYVLASASIHAADYAGKWPLVDDKDSTHVRVLPLITASLLNHGRVTFLTPEVRHDYQGDWERRLSGSYWVSGAFACGDGGIYLDVTERPIDLAGVLLHELDHLFRDRLLYNHEKLGPRYFELYADASGAIDWDRLELADEVSATVRAASWEFRFKSLKLSRNENYEPTRDIYATFPPMEVYKWVRRAAGLRPFQLQHDITLFSVDGPLQDFFTGILRGYGYPNDDALLASLGASRRIEAAQSYQLSANGLQDARKIVDRIQSGYLLDSKPLRNLGDVELIYPELSVDYRASFPVPSVFGSPVASSTRLLWLSPTSLTWPVLTTKARAINAKSLRTTWDGSPGIDLRIVMELLDRTVPDQFDPSRVCTEYVRGVENGTIRSRYAGAGLWIPAGARPAEKGTKPAEKGTKPAEKGTKPAEKGTKPATLVHPCVDVRDGI